MTGEQVPIRLRGRMRLWAAWLGTLISWAAIMMLHDRSPYEGDIFRRVRAVMPLTGWAGVMLAVGLALLVSAIWANALVWRVATIGFMTVAGTWFSAVLIAHHVDHVRLSPLGQVLWVWMIVSNVLAFTAATQWEERKK